MSDIKDLLGRAIGDDEPPMGIDRDEVFRVGRQRVRRRRTVAAGSAVAAVVIAAVGATVLTNFVGNQEPVPPAATGAPHAPPGPELPLTPSSTGGPPVTTESRPLSPRHADKLTESLNSSGIVRLDSVFPWPGQPSPLEFRVEEGVFLYEADVVMTDREGRLQVAVGAAKAGSIATCADIGEKYDTCETVTDYGPPVAQATWKYRTGEQRNVVVTVLPDGTKVAAVATNYSKRREAASKPPDGQAPVLDIDTLSRLIVKSGFSVS